VSVRLAARGLTVVPVGRSRERMVAAGAEAGLPADVKVVVGDSAERIAEEIARERPSTGTEGRSETVVRRGRRGSTASSGVVSSARRAGSAGWSPTRPVAGRRQFRVK
jgi:hypothetical protein